METLIYVALLIVLSSIVVATVLSLSGMFYQMRASRDVETSAVSSLERMVRDIRNADSVVLAESVLGVHPGRLTVTRALPLGGNEKMEFYLNGTELRVRRDGVDEGVLTSGLTSVESLVFTEVSSAVSSGVRIELTLKGEKGSATVIKPFDLFTVLRGSYK